MSDIIEEFLAEFLAQDSKKDGFATLVDGEGHPYVANLNPKEKSRYEETKKPLSQVKKEQKEAEKKGAEVVELHPEIKKTDKKTALFSTLYGRGNNIILDIAKRENPTLSEAEVNEII